MFVDILLVGGVLVCGDLSVQPAHRRPHRPSCVVCRQPLVPPAWGVCLCCAFLVFFFLLMSGTRTATSAREKEAEESRQKRRKDNRKNFMIKNKLNNNFPKLIAHIKLFSNYDGPGPTFDSFGRSCFICVDFLWIRE